jgi:parvulin-like peptidyl-prolyl isomerase
VRAPLFLATAAWLLAPGVSAVQHGETPPKLAPAPQSEAPAPRKPPPIVLAHVDGKPLTLDVAIDTFLSSHAGHGVLVRGEAAVRELAGRLVERELFLAEAEALGVPGEPQVVETVEAFRGEAAADELWKREVTDRVVVTDDEVESFYAKTDVALRLTLIECADRAAAERLRERVAAGEDMGALARSQSIHASRTFDGSLSYVRRGEIEKALEEAAFALETPPALSPVVATEKGFAFVRLDERSINPDRPPRDTALPQIRGILEERLRKRLTRETEERAFAAAEAWIDEARLTRENLLAATDATAVVARAAGDELTLQDVRDALDIAALRRAPPEAGADVALEVARHWTRREALIRAAREAGLFEHPAVVNKTDAFRRDVVMKYLCDRYVWPETEPEEGELQRYYEEHKATEFTIPAEVRLAYIVVATDEEAHAALARLAAGEDFEAVAREVSIDPSSKAHGGRIGWVKPGQLLAEVEERAFSTEVGAVGGPISTPVGSFVVKVLDRTEARLVPFASARHSARMRVVKERQRAAYAKWAEALRERASVELDEQGVRDAVQWLEGEALAREAEMKPSAGGAPAAKPPGH